MREIAALVAFALVHIGLLTATYLLIRDTPAIRRFEAMFKRKKGK